MPLIISVCFYPPYNREKKTNSELETTISAAEEKLAETGHQKESRKE